MGARMAGQFQPALSAGTARLRATPVARSGLPQTADAVVRDDLETLCDTLTGELDQMAGKPLLITGGAGFLGYYLVQTITAFNANAEKNRRIRLTVFDNFSRGLPGWLSSLRGQDGIDIVAHDLRHPLPDLKEEFAYVVHGASIASPTYYRKDPIATMDSNVNGLRTLLDYALGQKQKGQALEGFLFFSSSEIYGDPEPAFIPTDETYAGRVSCTGPRACYDEGKRYGETLCVNFARQHGIAVKQARPFNNYGPGLKITDGRLIPDFARDILAGRDIVMLSDGSPTRTFCYSADSVAGYFKVLVRGRPGEGYNIGTDKPEISVADLAQEMIAIAKDLFGYSGKVVRRESQDGDYLIDNPNRRCPVIEKARKELDYEPRVQLHEGLRRALLWYSANSDAEAK
jgi:UDP-glucuronate decarboxylase